MALNRRSGLDPRWALWGRDTLAGFMPATCVVYAGTDVGTPTWTPFDPDPAKRLPGLTDTKVKVYVGPCRLAQYKGARARQGQDVGQEVTDQTVTIQLALNGNTLPGLGNPDSWASIPPGSLVTVTNVAAVKGHSQSNAVTSFDYYVRIVDESSSNMTKDLFCDLVPNARGGPRGNLG